MGEVVMNAFLVCGLCAVLCLSIVEGEGVASVGVGVARGKKGTTSSSCDANDEAVLLQLAAGYEAFRGWNPVECCRSWENVTLNCSNSSRRWKRRVTAVSVEGSDLGGPFPQAICNLTALTRLYLSNAGLSGPLPPCLSSHGSLPRLRVLDLSANSLSGPLPASVLSRHPSLRHLDISFNSFSGSLPSFTSNSSALRTFAATDNLLDGSIPASVRAMQSLIELLLPLNHLSGTIPLELASLSNLTVLVLTANGLSGIIPPQLGSLSNLTVIDLALNHLSGSIPPQLGLLSNLYFLDLAFNHLSGTIPPQLGSLSNLNVLALAGNDLSGTIPPQLGSLSNLNFLALAGNDLSGTIPPQLGSLSNLYFLFLSFNRLSGAIPPQLGSFPHLYFLDLSYNRLDSAPFPTFLSNLSSLFFLSLAYNSFNSAIPPEWQNLTNLMGLSLSGNALSAHPTLPDWIFRLPLTVLQLSSLNLSSSQFSGKQLRFLNATLQQLDVSANHLSASSHILQCLSQISFPSLYYLNISSNPLNTFLPPAPLLLSSSNVIIMDMSRCGLVGQLPKEIFSSNLYSLMLPHNNLQGNIPSAIANISRTLKLLELSDNLFTGLQASLAENISISAKMVILLSNNSFGGDVGAFLRKVGGLDTCGVSHTKQVLNFGTVSVSHTQQELIVDIVSRILPIDMYGIQHLDLSFNAFTGMIPPHLANCTSLETLKLGSNYLTGTIPPELGTLSRLKALSLHDNHLKGAIPSALSNCSSLQVLDLSHNLLHGDLENTFLHLPAKTRKISSLRVLMLDDNHLTGPIPASLGSSSPRLQVLGLSRNLFTGNIPPQLHLPAFKKSSTSSSSNNLAQGTLYEDDITLVVKGIVVTYSYILNIFTSIDFSSNMLSGPIPPQLGDMLGLQYLNLSKNKLSGSIPLELTRLQTLESLDLAFNNLVGPIPTDMGSISSLETFNVSFNKGLAGQIPSGPQLEVLESYLGDDQLCGLPKPPCELRQNANVQNTSHQANHRLHLVRSVQKWASLPGIAVGFTLGFMCTVCTLNLRSIRRIYHRVCTTI